MSAAAEILSGFGYALFVREENGELRLQGEAPDWLRALWPSLGTSDTPLPIEQASPFLENFLIDAAECWQAGGETRASSGPWVETKSDRSEVTLEAIALTAGAQSILLIARQGKEFEAKKAMLQTARETVIAYQRLDSETQKKEILLSCIAEEMNSALANAITALRLIEMEKHSARAQQLLALAMRATEDQQALINKVLDVFASELADLYGRHGDAVAESSFDEVLAQAVESVAPALAEKRVQRRGPNEIKARVAVGEEQLARVLVNLLENALQNSPAGGEIALRAVAEAETVLFEVLDRGAIMPPNAGTNFFSKDVMTTEETTAGQLRLQFCRIAVEKCQGEFGSEPGEEGGNRFWVRLPKVKSAFA